MKKIITKNGLILAAFALAVTAIVALTHQATKSEISEQERKQLLRILDQVIDANSYDNALYKHCVPVLSRQFLGRDKQQRAFIALKGNQPIAIAIETTAPNGYSGNINILVGISKMGVVTGVRIQNHQETPGLGDKIDLAKSSWVESFNNKSSNGAKDPDWQVKKDGGEFDQFTGATITPRAVVQAVNKSLIFFKNNKDLLFTSAERCGEQ